MGLNNPSAGASFAVEYQSSALPWVTSSTTLSTPQEWDFNYATRFVSVINTGSGSLRLGFTSLGVQGSHYVTIPSGQFMSWEWRCAKVFIESPNGAGVNYSLAVGLTTIPAANFPVLSASWVDGTTWDGVG